eukprot:7378748-Pyramimonas_sp.AAC.1
MLHPPLPVHQADSQTSRPLLGRARTRLSRRIESWRRGQPKNLGPMSIKEKRQDPDLSAPAPRSI